MADEAVYPTSIAVLTDKVDEVDDIEAGHVNRLQNEIIALQTYVGTDPHGTLTNLSDRVGVSLGTNGALRSGATLPGTGSEVAGQPFYKTDTQQFLIHDGTNWDVMGPGGVSISTAFAFASATISPSVPLDMDKVYKVNYIFRGTSGANDGDIYFRTQTGATHTSNYDTSTIVNNAGTVVGSYAAGNTFGIHVCAQRRTGTNTWAFGSFNLSTIALAGNVGFINGVNTGYFTAGGSLGNQALGGHVNATSFDTFHFYTNGGLMEGSVWVYSHVLTL